MRISNLFGTAGLGLACAALGFASPYLVQESRVLKDKDIKKVAGALGDYYEALANKGKGQLEAEAEFMDELAKLNEKKLKGDNLLGSPGDVNALIYMANRYERKAPKRANGKVIEKTLKSSRAPGGKIEYAVWTPPKYKPKSGPYRLILSIPEEGMTPENHIKENYLDSSLLDTTVIAAPKMPGAAAEWTQSGIAAVLLTMRDITDVYAIDVEQVFIGGRGRGGEAALKIANMFPDRFAGTYSWAGDAGDGVSIENLQHVPVLIAGGGANATALEEAAKAAKLETVTLEPAGNEATIVAWMQDKRRVNYPTKFTIIPGERFPTRAYWAQFAPTEDMSIVRLDAEVNRETNTITLKGEGITECALFFSDGVVDMSRPVTVISNGTDAIVDKFERNSTLFLQFVKDSKSDSGRYYVASKQYPLPAVAAGDDEGN